MPDVCVQQKLEDGWVVLGFAGKVKFAPGDSFY